jgi:hypothetical protein
MSVIILARDIKTLRTSNYECEVYNIFSKIKVTLVQLLKASPNFYTE